MYAENSNVSETHLDFDAVRCTASLLGFDVDHLPDLSVNNPRVFGVIVDATVLRLTNASK